MKISCVRKGLIIITTASLGTIGAWSFLPFIAMMTEKSLSISLVEYATPTVIIVIILLLAFLKLISLSSR